jgi:predicted ATPase
MKITLPPKMNSTEQITTDSKSLVVVGANGAGKTRFGSAIESQHNAITHRIAAQKSLSMPEQVRPTSKEHAQSDFLYGHESGNAGNKILRRWGQKPNTYLLNDYEKLMVLLHTEEYEESVKFKDAYTPGQANNKPVTKLGVISKMVDWSSNPSWERANGSDRRTMGNGRTLTTESSKASGWQRQTESGQPSHLEWDLVDHANRSAMA